MQERALRGERGAWDTLVQQHEPALLRALAAQGLSQERAQELAQESWVRLWQQAQTGHLKGLDLPGLAIRQASFLARDAWRKQAHRQRLMPPEPKAANTVGPQARTQARASLAAIQTLLKTLPLRDQRLFAAVYSEGLPHSEAAARLGISTQRARQRLCEIRKRIRSLPECER